MGGAAASDTPIADSLASRTSPGTTPEDADGGAGAARMLDGDEIDQLASDTPISGDDIPGTSSTGTSGFGTDFGDVDSTHDTDSDTDTDTEVEGKDYLDGTTDSADRKTDLP
jgi:hypothetical protein